VTRVTRVTCVMSVAVMSVACPTLRANARCCNISSAAFEIVRGIEQRDNLAEQVVGGGGGLEDEVEEEAEHANKREMKEKHKRVTNTRERAAWKPTSEPNMQKEKTHAEEHTQGAGGDGRGVITCGRR